MAAAPTHIKIVIILTHYFTTRKRGKMSEYKKIVIKSGPGGWGGPLTVEPTPERNVIASITGGGIHPVAQKIAELTGGEAKDGFRGGVPFDKIACAVIDCGGTARVGVYPMKKVPTVDIYPTKPAGPLFRFITPEYFVSGVRVEDLEKL
jgi:glucitol/sorbitol PTS system EIIB component